MTTGSWLRQYYLLVLSIYKANWFEMTNISITMKIFVGKILFFFLLISNITYSEFTTKNFDTKNAKWALMECVFFSWWEEQKQCVGDALSKQGKREEHAPHSIGQTWWWNSLSVAYVCVLCMPIPLPSPVIIHIIMWDVMSWWVKWCNWAFAGAYFT